MLSLLSLALAVQNPPMLQYLYVDPLTDEQARVGSIKAPDGAEIMFACDLADQRLYIAFTGPKRKQGLLERRGPVSYRFDSDRPVSSYWYKDAKGASLPDDEGDHRREIARFITRLATGAKLLVRVRLYDESDMDVTFPLDGSLTARRIAVMRNVAAACPRAKGAGEVSAALANLPAS